MRTSIETELALPGEDRDATLRDALEDIDRLEATIAELLALARTPRSTQATLSARTLLDRVEARWTPDSVTITVIDHRSRQQASTPGSAPGRGAQVSVRGDAGGGRVG